MTQSIIKGKAKNKITNEIIDIGFFYNENEDTCHYLINQRFYTEDEFNELYEIANFKFVGEYDGTVRFDTTDENLLGICKLSTPKPKGDE